MFGIYRSYIMGKKRRKRKKNTLSVSDRINNFIFGKAWLYFMDAVYVMVLIYVLFLHNPFRPGLHYFGMELFSKEHLESVNLIPFYSISKVFYETTHKIIRVDTGVMNIGVNLILLLPYGYLLPQTFDKGKWTAGKMRRIAIVTAIGIELMQFFTMTGWTDIDDVIMNVTGAMIGFKLYRHMCCDEQRY